MIEKLKIQNFKSIQVQEFIIKPLTILTGKNSSGKSSVIQSLLLYCHHTNHNFLLNEYLGYLGEPKSLIYANAKEKHICFEITINKNLHSLIFDEEWKIKGNKINIIFEENLYYLSANRIGQEDIAKNNNNVKCGINGEYIFGFYERYKNSPLNLKSLIKKEADSSSLNSQVSYWLQYILELKLTLRTQKIDNVNIKTFYENNALENLELSPFNLGAGVSYLTKILILGLSLKQGDILIIENPEVHLHPRAIARLAEFFVFLSKSKIQIILETHSEHIINKIRYAVFKNQILPEKLQMYYRENVNENFIEIGLNKEGRYINDKNELINFPQGFFDSDLDELLEMS